MKSLAQKTAVGGSAAARSASRPCRPLSWSKSRRNTRRVGNATPASASAERKPASRSRAVLVSSGPTTAAMRLWPSPMSNSAAASGTADVVGRHARRVDDSPDAVEEHERQLTRRKLRWERRRQPGRHQHGTVDRPVEQPLGERSVSTFGEQHHPVSVIEQLVVDRVQQDLVQRVLELDDEGDASRRSRRQPPAELAAHVARAPAPPRGLGASCRR